MNHEHDHPNHAFSNSCCGAESLQDGVSQAIQRIKERNEKQFPSLYCNKGQYQDILRDFLINRQTRLSQINTEAASSWSTLEKAFAQLESKGFQIARYMDVYESDLAENLNLLSKSKEKAFIVYGTISILDDEKRLNLMLYAPEQPKSSYNRACAGMSSIEQSGLFKEVIEHLAKSDLPAEIGMYPGIIAVKGEFDKISYAEIDDYDLEFHLEMRVGLENLSM